MLRVAAVCIVTASLNSLGAHLATFMSACRVAPVDAGTCHSITLVSNYNGDSLQCLLPPSSRRNMLHLLQHVHRSVRASAWTTAATKTGLGSSILQIIVFLMGMCMPFTRPMPRPLQKQFQSW